MQVLKFGGSSVANAENINKVIAIVRRAAANDRTVVVSSAISGATDALLLIGKTVHTVSVNVVIVFATVCVELFRFLSRHISCTLINAVILLERKNMLNIKLKLIELIVCHFICQTAQRI